MIKKKKREQIHVKSIVIQQITNNVSTPLRGIIGMRRKRNKHFNIREGEQRSAKDAQASLHISQEALRHIHNWTPPRLCLTRPLETQ